MINNCNTSSLDAYIPSTSNPWDIKKVKHLYRRLGFGASIEMINDALNKTPSELIDNLITEAVNIIPIADPGWGYWDNNKFNESYESVFGVQIGAIADTRRFMEYEFFKQMRSNNLRARLTMLWSNHFCTEGLSRPPYLFQQHLMRETYAIGNFKDFVYQVGIDNMMLEYLNGLDNEKGAPNENYARELYELFTLGVDNGYTENDIVETARALTGYNTRKSGWAQIEFDEDSFDNSDKTIFGQTGNWNYDDVINILFQQKSEQIASFICGKFYKYFISPNINESVVAELANTFLENDFEIAPVMRQLFKSEHFFDDNSIGTIIKSPFDLVVLLEKEANLTNIDNETTRVYTERMGTRVFSPPNVAGWPGDEHWISSLTLPERWDNLGIYLRNYKSDNSFANLPLSLFSNVNENVENVARGLVDLFLSKELIHESEYTTAIDVFKGNVPSNYFDDGTWSLNYNTVGDQVYDLVEYLITIPEFQLK